MRHEKIKPRNPIRMKARLLIYNGDDPGFPIKVEEHPIVHRISLITYKILSTVVLTLRPFIPH